MDRVSVLAAFYCKIKIIMIDSWYKGRFRFFIKGGNDNMKRKQRNVRKRLGSILLTLAMVLALLPVMGGEVKAAPSYYELWIDGVQVTSSNCDDILGNGIFSYSQASNKLYISGDYTSTSDTIRSNIEGIKIYPDSDECTLTAPDDRNVIAFRKSGCITSDGISVLNLRGGTGIYAEASGVNLSIQDVNLDVHAVSRGIVGSYNSSIYATQSLYVRNSNVYVYAAQTAVSNFGAIQPLWLCRIQAPSGYIIRDEDKCITTAGGQPSQEVLFVAAYSDMTAINASGTNIRYASTGDLPWRFDEEGFAYSGNAGFPDSESMLQANVTLDEDMLLTFEVWALGEEPDCDIGAFILDYVEREDWLVTDEWVQYSILLEKGTHNLRWTYTKDAADDPVGDVFRLRNVSLKKVIREVNLRVGMEKPGVYFETPQITPLGDAHYSVDTAGWYSESYVPCNSFEAGKRDSLQIFLQADAGYAFVTPAVSINNSTAPIADVQFIGTGSEMMIQTPLYKVKSYEFSDVAIRPWQWNYEGIYAACENGIMTGDAKKDESQQTTTFRPKDNISRAEMVMILARLAGDHWTNQTDTGFTDVPYKPNKAKQVYYFDNLAWAAFHGIVTGYPDGTFRPNNPIIRADMAVLLFRLNQYRFGYGSVETQASVDITWMPDYGEIPKYAQEAMSWAYAEGLITGRDDGKRLAPKEYTQRQECATIVQRYINKFWQN